MPQMDQFAYVSQVIWLSTFLISLYFILLKNVLPKIYKSLRNRQFMFMGLRQNLIKAENEVFYIDWLFGQKSVEGLKLLGQLPERLSDVVNKDIDKQKRKFVGAHLDKREMDILFSSDKEVIVDLYYCQVIDKNSFLSNADKQIWRREFLKK